MLAFIDTPIQITVIMILILVVFGTEKMKSIIRTLRD
jgi:Sec-independent protein translocase protein TatA